VESIKRLRASCGEEVWVALGHIKSLIEAARAKELPVIYTTGSDARTIGTAAQLALEEHARRRGERLHSRRYRRQRHRHDDCTRTARYRDQEAEAVGLLWDKPGLLSHATWLRQRDRRRDNDFRLRARHVVDAFSLNYKVTLAEEGCFDRSEASHAVSLCDMHAKYADVSTA
jgi:maleamate amidohydrolase